MNITIQSNTDTILELPGLPGTLGPGKTTSIPAMTEDLVQAVDLGLLLVPSGSEAHDDLPPVIFDHHYPQVLPEAADRANYVRALRVSGGFHDGTAIWDFIVYYGNGDGMSCAFSDDGINWNNEKKVTGISAGGYEGLIAAQDCLPDNETRDKFAAEYEVLSRLWEVLSPDPCLGHYEVDYKWLTQVYESVKPACGHGKLLWLSLGAKTLELVHENVFLETVRGDLETLVMDAEVLEGILDTKDPEKKSKEIEIKLIARLRKHKKNPKFIELGERLEKLKEKHEQGLLHSLDFLKELLTLAKEVVEAEKQVDPEDEQDKAKAALTELFQEVKNGKTPVMVERIVADIDEVVRLVRFPGWQSTKVGEREVLKALRKVICVKYKIKDQDLFDKAYGYIRQYY